MRVIATAGHVDHGKSTLVRALTGTDPDRFAEEKRRGLTIDLGFAHAVIDGEPISFVDVPGHVRFLRNMLAGVGGVDACLFVVAATEGWMPQSEEHLRILELLGIRHGVVALTKVDLAGEPDLVELAALDVTEHVAGTFLDGAPVVPVAAPAGTGLDELRAALGRLARTTPAAVDRGRPRLWIDRVFAARGSGTVVTGTLTGGAIATGDRMVVEPGGRGVRVRSIQTHGVVVERIDPGNRVALNLSGIEHTELARGDAVVAPGQWHLTDRFDARLHVLASLDHTVSRRGAYLAYLGSGEHAVRLRVLGPDAIRPGTDALVRIHLGTAVPLLPGDRFVLRETGRDETVGGGEVLDVAPVLPASRARPDRRVERVVAERGWVDADELERLTGEPRRRSVGGWSTPTPRRGRRRRCAPASRSRWRRWTSASGRCSTCSTTSSSTACRRTSRAVRRTSRSTRWSPPSLPAGWRRPRRRGSPAVSCATSSGAVRSSSATGSTGTPTRSTPRPGSPPSCSPAPGRGSP